MELNEEIVLGWIELSAALQNSRLVQDLPYHEAVICNLLYQQQVSNKPCLSARDLCEVLHIAKSQMNRILTNMERKELISRKINLNDKRFMEISLNMDQFDVYLKQHKKVLNLVDKMITKYGIENTQALAKSFHEIAQIAMEVMND